MIDVFGIMDIQEGLSRVYFVMGLRSETATGQ